VASNFECVGLGEPDQDALGQLVISAMGRAELIARRGDRCLYRWQDPSGVRLLMSTEGDAIVDVLPSLAAEPGASVAEVQLVNDRVAFADIVDADGEVVTRLAAEFEQRSMLPDTAAGGRASIVALGVNAAVHDSPEAFASSDASLLGDGADAGDPPPHYVANGWAWPPRLGAESFVSYGVFNSGTAAQAYARLGGVVLFADVRTVVETGQRFIAARVRSAGFEADVCLPAHADSAAPAAGSVIAGTVFLVASLPDVALPLDPA
jgi:hypothetical protein